MHVERRNVQPLCKLKIEPFPLSCISRAQSKLAVFQASFSIILKGRMFFIRVQVSQRPPPHTHYEKARLTG